MEITCQYYAIPELGAGLSSGQPRPCTSWEDDISHTVRQFPAVEVAAEQPRLVLRLLFCGFCTFAWTQVLSPSNPYAVRLGNNLNVDWFITWVILQFVLQSGETWRNKESFCVFGDPIQGPNSFKKHKDLKYKQSYKKRRSIMLLNTYREFCRVPC